MNRPRNRLTLTLATLTTMLFSTTANSDLFIGRGSCFEPHKPFDMTDSYEFDRWVSDVEQYRDCLTDFVNEQYRQAQAHVEAAESAKQDWEWFVQRELQ